MVHIMKDGAFKKVVSKKFMTVVALFLIMMFSGITVYASDVEIAQVSAGGSHTAIVGTDGSLWVCGENSYGQLGDGTYSDRKTPVKIMTGVRYVSAGSNFTAILKTDGSLWMVGENAYGQLGNGKSGYTAGYETAPVKIMTGVQDVCASGATTAIVKTDGSLWMCGDNSRSLYGNGSFEASDTPVKITTGVKTVKIKNGNTAVIKTDGSLWMWGYNASSQLAGVSDETYVTTPLKIMSEVKDVSVGGEHTAILKTDGSLWLCGQNESGQFGDGTQSYDTYETPINVMTGVKAVYAEGGHYTAALKTDGSLWICGTNLRGELGTGYENDEYSFVRIATGVKDVSAGGLHSGIIKTDGTLWMCGNNEHGQLGDGTTTNRYSPVQIKLSASGTTNKYTVTFNPNEGALKNTTTNKKNVVNGQLYGALPDAARSGYAFLGWFTKKEDGKEIKKDTIVNLTKNQTLYAHWSPRVSIKNASINIPSCTYDGLSQKPDITITYKGKALKVNTDYKVEFSNNKNATEAALATVKGVGLYKGTVDQTFIIKPRSLSSKTVSISLKATAYNCTGEAITPKYTAVFQKGNKDIVNLKKDTDFSVIYSKNVLPGTGKVTFKGKGNFKGSVECSFVINKIPAQYTKNVSAAINEDGYRASVEYADYFFQSGSVRNIYLFRFAALLCASYYNSTSSTRSLLSDCGFSKNLKAFYTGKLTDGISKGTRKNNDHCTVITGEKQIVYGSGYKRAICIVINGYSGDGYEWISDFNLGKGKYHKGFKQAADEAYRYIKNTFGNMDDTVILITGHSRGGAITNLLAQYIISDHEISNPTVFAYGFATPNVCLTEKLVPTNRIYNLINRSDFVPDVPLSGKNWGYGKSGYIKNFTVSSSMKEKFLKYTGKKKFCVFKEDEEKELIKYFNKASNGSREGFYKERIERDLIDGVPVKVNPADFCKNGLALAMVKNTVAMAEGGNKLLSYQHCPGFNPLVSKLVVKGMIIKEIIHAHMMETYLAAAMTMNTM